MIGGFCENNTEHTRVRTLLGEKQSFLTACIINRQTQHITKVGSV